MKRGFLKNGHAKKGTSGKQSKATISTNNGDGKASRTTAELPKATHTQSIAEPENFAARTENIAAIVGTHAPILVVSIDTPISATEEPHVLQMTTIFPKDPTDTGGPTEWLGYVMTRRKILALPDFPKAIPQPPGGRAYAVRQAWDMGLGVFATRAIKAGTLVAAERPMFVAPANIGAIRVPMRDGEAMSLYKLRVLDGFESVLEKLVARMADGGAKVMELVNCHTKDGSGPLTGRIRTNGFGEDLFDDAASAPAKDFYAYSMVGEVGSRFNHSCIPNITRTFDLASFSLLYTTTRDAKAGDELFLSYCPTSLNVSARQAQLASYGFMCLCEACVAGSVLGEQFGKTIQHIYRNK